MRIVFRCKHWEQFVDNPASGHRSLTDSLTALPEDRRAEALRRFNILRQHLIDEVPIGEGDDSPVDVASERQNRPILVLKVAKDACFGWVFDEASSGLQSAKGQKTRNWGRDTECIQ